MTTTLQNSQALQQTLTDGELLEWITVAEGDLSQVRSEIEEFHKRHFNYLTSILREWSEKRHHSWTIDVDQWAIEAFLKCLANAKSFKVIQRQEWRRPSQTNQPG